MKILFLTIVNIINIDTQNIYSDLVRELAKKNNEVYLISPFEKKFNCKTGLIEYKDSADYRKRIHILKFKIGNIQKTNFIEKGISTILFEKQLKHVLKKNFNNVKFDLIVYSTPPITFTKTIKYIKNKSGARTYLLLKDIFPQNAVDLQILSKHGIKGIVYKYFKRKEKSLYKVSDKIGCMSQKNCEYLLKQNSYLTASKLEVFPNCIDPKLRQNRDLKTITKIKKSWGLPFDKKIIISGGNFGKPQDVSFIKKCLKTCESLKSYFFVIVGAGTDFYLLKNINFSNCKIIDSIDVDSFNNLLLGCDIGWITLDYRFTIPNFPSRLLSYMQAKLPIIICANNSTDIGDICELNHFGWKTDSLNSQNFKQLLLSIKANELNRYSFNSYNYLIKFFNVKKIINKFDNL